MGSFAQTLKKIFNPKSGVKTDNTILFKNAYFIHLSDKPECFIHFVGETKDDVEYRAKVGHVGAAVWTYKNAMAFVEESGASNLSMIRIDQVIKHC